MKRYGNLYEEIYDFENLYNAYLEARKNKRFRSEVLKFSANLEENLISIQNKLIYKTYEVGEYREFYLYEPKKRLIMALPFEDRVIQWAIYRVINPIFDNSFMEHSYSCRVGKGSHKAANKLQYWLREVDRKPKKYYYLKMDISKYFYRVDHDVTMAILKRKIKDIDTIYLLEMIIRNEDVAFGLPLYVNPGECNDSERLYDKGMPIGNLTSQLIANVYLNELDQYCKHELKIKYWIRYADDFISLHYEKEHLHYLKSKIEKFLNNELKLHLNNKTCIRPIATGIEFVGFRIWPTHKKLKKKTAIKIKRNLKYVKKAYSRGKMSFEEVNAVVQSSLGILSHCNGYRLTKTMLKDLILVKQNDQIEELVNQNLEQEYEMNLLLEDMKDNQY